MELVSSSSFLTPVILFFFGKKIEKVDEKINRTLRKKKKVWGKMVWKLLQWRVDWVEDLKDVD